MTILLYRYTGDPTRVYKTDYIEASSVLSLDGELRDESSVIDPVILITTETNLSFYNYAYVDYFARYYFARFEVVRTGVWRAILHSDVLSNAGYYFIQKSTMPVVVGRSESFDLWSKRLADGEYPIPAGYTMITVETPSQQGTAVFNEEWDTGLPFVVTVAGRSRGGVIVP